LKAFLWMIYPSNYPTVRLNLEPVFNRTVFSFSDTEQV
jgi:hypothetical protein